MDDFQRPSPGLSRRHFIGSLIAAGAVLPAVGPASAVPAKPPKRKTTLPICVFSKHLQFLPYDEMAAAALDAGFDGVDLTVRPGGHVLPEDVEAGLPRAVEAVRKAGLDVHMMTTDITDPRDDRSVAILATAAELGVRYYRMGYLSYDDNLGITGSIEHHRSAMGELAALNRRFEIHGAYQNHQGTRVGSPVWDLWMLLEGLDPESIGVQYDVRHAVVEGGTAWPLGLKLLAPFIRITAIKDFVWTPEDGSWRLTNVPLGDGMVDFGRYFSIVRENEVAGPISLHFEYPMPGEREERISLAERRRQTVDVMRRDVERLRSMMAEAGLS
jgi:sugar phosphate isomerase/epimerase